jgi:hypothetical protein
MPSNKKKKGAQKKARPAFTLRLVISAPLSHRRHWDFPFKRPKRGAAISRRIVLRPIGPGHTGSGCVALAGLGWVAFALGCIRTSA